MKKKYFGTDGIRGRVGAEPITPDFVMKLGWAAGRVFARQQKGHRHSKIIIGKDTRISGYMFESALEAGLVAAGVDVALLGPMPTPAVAYLTRTFQANAGIVISASHNPYYDNGIKFFSAEGTKLPDDLEQEIEAQLELPMTCVDSSQLGKVQRITDAGGRYIEFCKGTVPARFSLAGVRIVVDCAHGATYHVAPQVFSELGAEVKAIGVEPNGLNINEYMGSTSPKKLQETVVLEKADLGIAFDGDGDRVVFVDHRGELVDGDELLYIIARDQQRTRGSCKGVVGTLMTNLGMELALRELDIPFARASVGDRYVVQMMKDNGWDLGGESSGHIVCTDVTTTGDGIVAALKVLFAMVSGGKTLHELKSQIVKFPQTMINVRVAKKIDVDAHDGIQSASREVEARLQGRGRVLLRASGTEPVIRVMVEGEDGALVKQLAEELAQVVEGSIS